MAKRSARARSWSSDGSTPKPAACSRARAPAASWAPAACASRPSRPAGANVFVRVHADGVALLNDVQLEVDYRTFWRTSRLAGELALGAGYRFP